MAASSSQVPCGKYDVFISFRGTDVRFGFLSHLERELRRKNIDVYVDDRLQRGEEISSSLVKAIEGSRIALVIFSKDYASSRWCLEELVKIMKCKEVSKQIVIPVFYLIDPSDVRHQKRTYAEAFTLHEEKSKVSMDNVQIWRSVLKKSAKLSGHHSSAFRNESQLIDAIVEDVLKKLEDNSPIMPQSHLIGFHQNFTGVESLMEIELQEVRILGIWGMGGIGKTTLAHAIFDKFLSKFGSHCFLENVREKATKIGGLNSLHQELISKLLNTKDHIDIEDAKRRLQGKQVLIVLDDVDNPKQLKDLVRLFQLGPGSRVIVTSRDSHVLRSGGIEDQFIHEVIELSLEQSLELFSMHAFNQSHPKIGYEELSQKTVAIATGIPLALEVLGSHFHSRDKAYWESELSKLEMYPRKQIRDILEISYHGLDPTDKEIFLDIAFFWLTFKKDEVTYYLEAFGFEAVSGIQNLIDKALIKLGGWDEYILMHDLIREMAEQIVHGESKRHLKRCSRLKDAKEIYNALTSKTEMDEIEGIGLDLRKIQNVQVEADIFLRMKNLRFLTFYDDDYDYDSDDDDSSDSISQHIDPHSGLENFPDKLRYLRWDHYPLNTLPSGFYLKNLVELYIPNSHVKRLWDGKQDLGNLRKMNLSWSKQLIELPDLSMAHKLESVDLTECRSLRSVHPSILSLPNIIVMSVDGCFQLESIESETHLECFFFNHDLDDEDFLEDRKFCLSSNKLSRLCLEETEVEIFHFPIRRFRELKRIRICDGLEGSVSIDELCCLRNLEVFEVTNLKQVIDTKLLHSLFDAWRDLRILSLEGCSDLSEIPDNIKTLTRLEYLSLNDSAVETLPICVSHLSSLTKISLRRCKRLKSILGLPPFLGELDASECTLLETVSSDSLVRFPCVFNLCNCEKLDQRSLRCNQELLSSMNSHDFFYGLICYPGSRVPEWMEYKPMTEAFNATEFTCNLERSQHLLICCVAPSHLVSQQLKEVHCYFSYDDNNKFHRSHKISYPALNRDHVLLWPETTSLSARIGNDAKISCEFFLEYWDEVERASYKVPAKACGIHLLHYSQSGQSRKRVADIRVEDQLPFTKQL
ncbi:hypothetical protein QN277_022783 [Acacia crassicarpa]|uniref:TIR domain-containing protein n=1 Tax=Acacia crassicarpa TaxID=499986 RepID=A0AAE1JKF7_9FABA|nr:hypothetical protein QN277_022783 [Acacia crassicarpa]